MCEQHVSLRKDHDCSSYQNLGKIIGIIELICGVVFIVEVVLKLILYKKSFFADNWNILDLVIVCPSLLMLIPGTALYHNCP